MNLRTEKLPPASVESMQVLAGLYRSTFVDKMRERFRLMLTGAYAVYVSVLEDQSDPALRTHLADVLHEIAAHAGTLVEAFEEELMRSFRAATGADLPEGSATMEVGARGVDPMAAPSELDDGAGIRELVARSIKGYDTRYGSIILALTRIFAKLTDQPVEGFRPPWTPAKLYSAFAVSLDCVGMPIQGMVKLALYKMFSQEVLRYLGDGCMNFRYALPQSLSELNKPFCDGVSPSGPSILANSSQISQNEDKPHGAVVGCDSEMARALAQCEAGEAGRGSSGDTSGTTPRKLRRVGFALLGGIALLPVGWCLARMWPLPTANREPPVAAGLGQAEMMMPVQGSSGGLLVQAAIPPTPAATPPHPNQGRLLAEGEASPGKSLSGSAGTDPVSSGDDFHGKRERLRGLKLKNFTWRIDGGTGELLLNLTLANTNLIEVGGIEVVCSQYSESLDFLEAAKVVLAEPVEAGQTKAYKGVPIGAANAHADRLNCVVADLGAMASR